MVDCAFCEKPLTCESCGATYQPPDLDAYQALSYPEQPITCSSCGELLVCHWCKTPYSGEAIRTNPIQEKS